MPVQHISTMLFDHIKIGAIAVTALVSVSFQPASEVYMSKTGTVKFVSDAPLERIEAQSNKLSGALNVTQRTVAFSLPILSFQGFNDPLQQEHFNENYMESNQFPKGTFSGKIIEEVDLSKAGTYKVRAKGMMNIHGVEKERIIAGTLVVNASGINLKSAFDVPLADHEITIPKIVNQKISEVINVEISADLKPQS